MSSVSKSRDVVKPTRNATWDVWDTSSHNFLRARAYRNFGDCLSHASLALRSIPPRLFVTWAPKAPAQTMQRAGRVSREWQTSGKHGLQRVTTLGVAAEL
jgi:hypothetical protein